MRPMRNGFAFVLASALVISGYARADEIDDFNNGWTGRSLIAQRLLDLDAPIADNNIIGSHNSFNSGVYATATSYLDPNQVDSIYNQLRMGARAVEMDVHWTPKAEGLLSFPDRLLLCHGTASHLGCSLDDRYFAESLDEVAVWLNSADSTNQVLILHIEDHMDGQYGEAYSQVTSRIGNWIYTSGGCGDISGGLTKADVLAAGKKVLIWNEGGCSGDANWDGMVFTGLGGIARVWEDSTVIGGNGGASTAINDADVIAYFAGGTNLVDLDQMNQNDSRFAAAVWSWDVNEPNNFGGNEDCAIQLSNGRWNDADCNSLSVFACEHAGNGSWTVTPNADGWGAGGLACANLGSDYLFSVPKNSQDNQALRGAKEAAGQSTVWMNRDDRFAEGVWTTSDTEDIFYSAGALRLSSGQSVSGKTRRLTMEPDCNLELDSLNGVIVGGDVWNSGTANVGTNCYTDFQSDGNLVLYDGGGQPQWSSSTSGAELRLQADGNAVIYDGGGSALWQTFTNYPREYSLGAGVIVLTSGQILHSQNRKLELRIDCNLVLFSFENGVTGGALWQSNTSGAGTGCYADLQPDGNFVLYDGGGQAHWNSGTSGTSGAELRLQGDGNLAVYNGVGEPLWSTNTNLPLESTFFSGQFLLSPGQFVQTQNRRLEMQSDCNVVLHSFENAALGGTLWQSDTVNAGINCYVDFQADGNFVVYGGSAQALWASGTSGTSGGELRLQSDGNLVVYNGAGQPLWSSNSNIPSQLFFNAGQFTLFGGQFVQSSYRRLEMQDDCNLVMYNVTNGLPNDSLWHSDTAGAGVSCYVDFQADGNLVIYDGSNQLAWASGTSGTSGAQLFLQSDGNGVLYNGVGSALWQTSTQGLYVAGSSCGDLTCDGSETCSTCPGDCGVCVPICGDLVCDASESCSTCPGDCGVCGSGGPAVPALSSPAVSILFVGLLSCAVLLARQNTIRRDTETPTH